MANNVYGSGLRNVGSYQVSGKPYVTGSTVSDGTEQKIEFSEVTNNVTIKYDSTRSGLYKSLYFSGSHLAVTGSLALDGSDLHPTSSVSFTWWGKPAPKGGSGVDMTLMGFGNSWNGNDNTLTQDKNNANVHWINALGDKHTFNDGLLPSGYSNFDSEGFANDWFHYALTLESSNDGDTLTAAFYRNGQALAGTNETRNGTNVVNHNDAGASDPIYRSFHIGGFNPEVYHYFADVILWDGALSPTQVDSLYQASASYSSSGHNPDGLQKVCWLKPTGSVQEIELDDGHGPVIPFFKNFGISSDLFLIRMGGSDSYEGGTNTDDGSDWQKIVGDSPFEQGLETTSLLISSSVGYISENSHGMTDGQNFTITAWYKPYASGSSPSAEDLNDFIFGFANSLPAHTAPNSTRPALVLARAFTSGQTNFNLIDDSEGARCLYTSQNIMLEDQWNHIALIVSSSNSSDYTVSYLINNTGATSSPATVAAGETHDLVNYNKFFIGGYNSSSDRHEEARFRDVIVWNDALTTTQVENIASAYGDYTNAAFEPIIDGDVVEKKFWLAPSVNPTPSPHSLVNYGTVGGNFIRQGQRTPDVVNIVDDSPYTSTKQKVHNNSLRISGSAFLSSSTDVFTGTGAGESYSVSMWVKYPVAASVTDDGTAAYDNNLLWAIANSNARSMVREKQNHLSFIATVGASGASVVSIPDFFENYPGQWNFLTFVAKDVGSGTTTETTVSLNGVIIDTDSTSGELRKQFPNNATATRKFYVAGTPGKEETPNEQVYVRDVIMWDGALSPTDITTLYNGGNYYDFNSFTTYDKLVWIKPVDPSGTSYNGSSTIINSGTTGGNFEVVDYDEASTIVETSAQDVERLFITSPRKSGVGNLRIHFRSTGSSNVATNKHYWSLSNKDEKLEMNVKTKEIYLSADSGHCDFSIQADLTNIPSSRMYEHTGSGVDE
ncbi:MAG: putative concanavalin A-like lectin/glucanases superfamily protein [Prokaryotic dsDNA virus sp.]|nr:MAG: putative concanavalin A-like lectin/glucanases superfamily protein [Prokaryotic dsDNA virus sp.]|tara:strand:+ start:5479 stop:8322 length:2844 start_codon:yes stop_codon:yes gene_type:complete